MSEVPLYLPILLYSGPAAVVWRRLACLCTRNLTISCRVIDGQLVPRDWMDHHAKPAKVWGVF